VDCPLLASRRDAESKTTPRVNIIILAPLHSNTYHATASHRRILLRRRSPSRQSRLGRVLPSSRPTSTARYRQLRCRGEATSNSTINIATDVIVAPPPTGSAANPPSSSKIVIVVSNIRRRRRRQRRHRPVDNARLAGAARIVVGIVVVSIDIDGRQRGHFPLRA